MTLTEWVAITGAVTGIAGMVLGIVSTIDMLQKKRVSLRVVPKVAFTNPAGIALTTHLEPSTGIRMTGGRTPDRLAVEIVNLSAFPVTISEVGFGRPDRHRLAFIVPEVSPGYTWPPVVEPRRAVIVYQRVVAINVTSLPGNLYVETECGAVKKARSAALDWFVTDFNGRSKDNAAKTAMPTGAT